MNIQDGARLHVAMNGFWGIDQSVLFLMFASSIHLPPLMPLAPSLLVIGNMRMLGRKLMNREFMRLSMLLWSSRYVSYCRDGS